MAKTGNNIPHDTKNPFIINGWPIDGDIDGDHTDPHLSCSAYCLKPGDHLRKNSNSDNEKDGV